MTPDQAKTIRNERFKLLAQAFDRASTACVLVGFLSPLALGLPLAARDVAPWIGSAIALHFLALAVLGRLR